MDPARRFAYKVEVQSRQFQVKVRERQDLSGGYFCLALEADEPCAVQGAKPGQFVMLRGDWGRDLINGRAFSVLDVQSDRQFSVLAKVFGRGTLRLSQAEAGEAMTVTGPLGQGFEALDDNSIYLLVAGGVGLPPLHFYARQAALRGKAQRVEFLYGGRSEADLVLLDELRAHNITLHLSTDDGSAYHHGRITEPLLERLDSLKKAGKAVKILSCGPTPMLKAVRTIALEKNIPAYLCLEEQMACGFGVCLGCAVPVYGDVPYQYCCTNGPVFEAKELRWS